MYSDGTNIAAIMLDEHEHHIAILITAKWETHIALALNAVRISSSSVLRILIGLNHGWGVEALSTLKDDAIIHTR